MEVRVVFDCGRLEMLDSQVIEEDEDGRDKAGLEGIFIPFMTAEYL